MKNIAKFTFLYLFLFMGISSAFAAEGEWGVADEMKARLISGVQALGTDGSFDAAMEVRMSPGWHSYWRSPGDSGLPPRFNWDGSTNLQKAEVFFPAPKRFDEMGLTTFGYSGDVTFPMKIFVEDPTKDTNLALRLDTMVCNEICIPQSLSLSMNIPAGSAQASKNARLIEFANTKVPSIEDYNDLKIENITLGPDAIVINAYSPRGFDGSDVFVEFGEYALTEKPSFEVPLDDEKRAMIVVPLSDAVKEEYGNTAPAPYSDVDIKVTLTNGRKAVERTLVIN
jgi:suppressor for copper-sensitivity B